GLAVSDEQQHLPQVVAVVQLREAALLGGAVEAVEGRQGDVLLVGGAPRQAAEFAAGAPDQEAEVALPEGAGGVPVALLELVDPVRDRPDRGHRSLLAGARALDERPGS